MSLSDWECDWVLVEFEAFRIDLTLVFGTFEIYPNKFLEVECLAIIFITIIRRRIFVSWGLYWVSGTIFPYITSFNPETTQEIGIFIHTFWVRKLTFRGRFRSLLRCSPGTFFCLTFDLQIVNWAQKGRGVRLRSHSQRQGCGQNEGSRLLSAIVKALGQLRNVLYGKAGIIFLLMSEADRNNRTHL